MNRGLLRLGLLLTICYSLFTTVNAQQDAQYSMYRYNGLYINPAYTGSREVVSMGASYRYQWVKIPGAPMTGSFAIHSPLKNERLAIGGIYTYDRIGVTQTNSANVSFAYRIPVGKKKKIKLCIGLSAGFDHYQAKLNDIATTDPNDPNFVGNNQSRWLPNVGFGMYVYSESFFVGASLPRLLTMKLNGKMGVTASDQIARQYYHLLVSGGYVFNLGKKVKFIPSLLMKYQPIHAPVSFDFNATFVFIDRVWVGAAYRLNDSYNFMVAVNATRQLRIGYTYDLTVSALRRYTSGTHEVFLGFDFDFRKGKVVNPRYVKYF